MQIPCVYLPGPAPAVSVGNTIYLESVQKVLVSHQTFHLIQLEKKVYASQGATTHYRP